MRTLAVTLLALMTALAIAAPAAAHASKTSADGKVRVTWGWIDEPALTMEPNRLDLIIRDNATGAGIGGLETADLHVAIHHGDKELDIHGITTQRGKGPGNYTSERVITPTAPGLYILHIEGDINGSHVELEIAATHEMEDVARTYFPPLAEGDLAARVKALEAQVAALDAKLKTQAETPATVTAQSPPKSTPGPGSALGLLAVGAVAVALALRRGS